MLAAKGTKNIRFYYLPPASLSYSAHKWIIILIRVSKVEIEIEIISKNLDLVSISNLEIWNSRSRLSKILKPHIFGKFCIEFFEFLIDFDKLSTYSSIIVNMKQISSMKTLNLYFVGSSKWFLFVIFNNESLITYHNRLYFKMKVCLIK